MKPLIFWIIYFFNGVPYEEKIEYKPNRGLCDPICGSYGECCQAEMTFGRILPGIKEFFEWLIKAYQRGLLPWLNLR
jgi:hypothetical protein